VKSVDEHLAAVLAGVAPLPPIEMPLLEAHGCVLTDDVVAPVDLPRFDNSAMDGYAVRVSDVANASPAAPVRLSVLGDVAAGTPPAAYRVDPSVTVRIMTGAPVPDGADAVVPVEWTDGGVRTVAVTRGPLPGEHVRRRGEDVTAGDVVLRGGIRLGPAQLGLLAGIGFARVRVRPRPRVVVVSTGSELVEPGQAVAPGQICESNSYLLTAAARDAGAIAFRVGIIPDDASRLLGILEDQLSRADVLITTGGVSVGAYDVVKEVLLRLGTVRFDRVAMQPGMPQGFGTLGPDSVPIFTLPGNPVSAYVSFEVFVRPALRRLLGVEPLHRPAVRAVCAEPVTSPPGKRRYLRAWAEGADGTWTVRAVGGRGSHLTRDLAAANALIVVPEPIGDLAAGDKVDVLLLERRMA
jgi:molybdopterin molybdotransferase